GGCLDRRRGFACFSIFFNRVGHSGLRRCAAFRRSRILFISRARSAAARFFYTFFFRDDESDRNEPFLLRCEKDDRINQPTRMERDKNEQKHTQLYGHNSVTGSKHVEKNRETFLSLPERWLKLL